MTSRLSVFVGRPALRRLSSNALVVGSSQLAAAQFLGAAASLLLEVVIDRKLGVKSRGVIAVIQAATQLSAVLGAFALANIAVRFLDMPRARTRNALATVVIGTFPFALAVSGCAITVLVFAFSLHGALTVAATLCLLFVSGFVLNGRQMVTGLDRVRDTALSVAVERGGLLLAGGAVILAGGDLAGYVAAWAVVLSVVVFFLLRSTIRGVGHVSWRRDFDATLLSELTRRGSRVVLANILQFTNYRMDIFLVAAWKGPREAGLYGLATSLAGFLWYIPDSAGQAAYPELCRELAAGRRPTRVLRLAKIVLLVTVSLALVGGLVGFLVIPSVFGRSFARSALLLVMLLPGVALFSYAKITAGSLVAAGRESKLAAATAVAAVVTVVGDIATIPSFGAAGAAATSSVAYSIYALAIIRGMHDVLPGSRRPVG